MIRLFILITFLMVASADAGDRGRGWGHRGHWHGPKYHHWYRPPHYVPGPLDAIAGGFLGGLLGSLLRPPPPPPEDYRR